VQGGGGIVDNDNDTLLFLSREVDKDSKEGCCHCCCNGIASLTTPLPTAVAPIKDTTCLLDPQQPGNANQEQDCDALVSNIDGIIG
jgi:hypothetical protein